MGVANNAALAVTEALLGVLPPGVPPSFIEITRAAFEGSGRNRKVVADLVMVDGLPATVEVWNAGPCTAHRWTNFPGGNLYWNARAWVRETDLTLNGQEGSTPADGALGRRDRSVHAEPLNPSETNHG